MHDPLVGRRDGDSSCLLHTWVVDISFKENGNLKGTSSEIFGWNGYVFATRHRGFAFRGMTFCPRDTTVIFIHSTVYRTSEIIIGDIATRDVRFDAQHCKEPFHAVSLDF